MKFLTSVIFLSLIYIFVSTAAGQSSVTRDLPNEIDAYLKLQAEAGFSGSVLVVKGGKKILDRSYGPAAGVGSEPKYWIASNSKSFVAAAALRLAEQGKLSVKDPIAKFLRDVPADKREITVHHLLTHTSGIPHRYVADGKIDREAAVRALLAIPLAKKVGEAYLYSNDGYNLLAAIVEAASGRTFEEYLRVEVLDRAGLKDTGFWGFEKPGEIAPVANPASVQAIGPSIYKGGRSVANWGYRGATGVYSTVGDVHRWMIVLREGKVLSPGSVGLLWSKQAFIRELPPNDEAWYGYGWSVLARDGGERRLVRHTGYEDWLGHSSVMTLFENGDAIVVLSNAGANGQSAWASVVYRELHKLVA